MRKFKFKAINLEKKKFSGTYLAESEDDLRIKLSEMDLFLVSSKEVKEGVKNPFASLLGNVSSKELAGFCTQFSILLDSSMEAIDCLNLLKEQQKNSYFKKVLESVCEDVQSGMSIAKAMEKHKKVFPNFVVSMIYVGEMSSSLNVVLKSLADYIESDNKLKAKVKGALIYPTVIMILMLSIIILMMVFVIQTFRTSLGRLEVEMPALTMAIYNISDFFVANWLYVLAVIVGVILLTKLIVSTKKGKYAWDKIKINTPLIKKIARNLATARLARGLGLLLRSGMKLVEGMEIAKKLIGNSYVERKFEKAISDVQEGKALVKALEDMKIFDKVFIQMVGVAEKTATLENGMFRASTYYDEQASATLTNLTNLIQPAMLIIVGIVVAVIFLAVYSPITAMMTGIS